VGVAFSVMTALFATLLVLGLALLVFSALWAWRTRHERRLWRATRHDTAKAAIVLELEDKVRELETLSLEERPPSSPAVDVR
jgi:hypothetical protein